MALGCGDNPYAGTVQQTVRLFDEPAEACRIAIDWALAEAQRRINVFKNQPCPGDCDSKKIVAESKRILNLVQSYNADEDRYVATATAIFYVQVGCSKTPSPTTLTRPPVTAGGTDVPPVTTGTPPDDGSKSGTGSTAVAPKTKKCTVSTKVADTSQSSQPGAPWDIDIQVSATASDPDHSFQVGGVTLLKIQYFPGTPTLGWSAAELVGATFNLNKPQFGFVTTPGPGTLRITGTLYPGVGGISLIAGHNARFSGTATDSNGDSAPWECIRPF